MLLYGTDAGLVSERGAALAALFSTRENPAGEIVRLADEDLEDDPGRLAIELLTVPMFGGRKIIRAASGRRVNTASLKPLIEETGLAGILIVEAGNLKPDDSLRGLFEKSAKAAAIACYGDDAQDLDAVIRDVLGAAGLKITPPARQMLLARLGADRALSRREIEKLALFAAGKSEIDETDVEAIVGDASEMAIDRIIHAAAAGHSARASQELSRALEAGENAQMIIGAVQRHFQRLHRVRAAVDRGQSIDTAVQQLRPPLHFKQKDAVAAQCRAWQTAALTKALEVTAATAKSARLTSALEDVLVERLVLTLARLARDSAKQPGLR